VIEKVKKTKRGKPFWVCTENDGLLTRHYSGPDRNRAREVAAKLLAEPSKGSSGAVTVVRIGKITVLSAESLKAQLPKDAF
jgi:hypothetical protein